MSLPNYLLSKTAFLKLEQCEKSFFLYRNFPYLKDKADPEKMQRFKRGHDVGHLAQGLFPGGQDVSELSNNMNEALALTAKLLGDKCPVIYEATFKYKGLLVMVDILVLEDGKYRAYEVKSSLKVSEIYLRDACLQFYVLHHCLPNLSDFFLVTINGDYVLDGALDIRHYFKKRSISEKALANLSYFESRLDKAAGLLEENRVPEREIGPHCFRPYTCDFFGHCWKGKLEEDSLFNFPFTDKLKIFDWYAAGYRKLRDLGPAQLEKPWQRIIQDCLMQQKSYLEKEALSQFLNRQVGKRCAMDLEVWNPAVPELEGSRPFEHIPFLWSFNDGETEINLFYEHREDEREKMVLDLLEVCKAYDTLVVYDKTLECAVLDNLAKRFPEQAEALTQLRDKILDLFEPFAKHWFYHPGFRNNLSLKSITGVLVPEFRYGDIRSGLEALQAYDLFRKQQNPLERELLKDKLMLYCQNDCKAVMQLLDYLNSL